MQKKKLYACIACIALLVGTVAYQTFAYFTTESTTTNVISTGYVDMELYEEITADGVNWEFLPTGEMTNILPGDTVEQKAYITNTGSEDFYARVSVEVSIVSATGESLDASVVSFNIDPTLWVEDTDGWYRYVNVVESGETTADPVFTEVYFS
ncbi:MAG: TasA family protein, partial [Clostridia bacterium]